MVLHDLPSLDFVGVPYLVNGPALLFPGHSLGYPASRGIQIQAALRGWIGQKITVLCVDQNRQVDWNSVLRGTAGGHHHVSCI